MLCTGPVLADSHQFTFVNNCDQTVWVNVQGGPPGICDNNIDPATHKNVQCSACSSCADGSLCNTSVTTGASLPMCCPLLTDLPRCWNGEQCSKDGCCPQIAQTANTTYPCPGITSTATCQNTSMTYDQIANLSGYNNPASGHHRAACNGSVIGGGGFSLAANGGSQTYDVNDGWQGAWFGRTNCNFNDKGEGNCETGDCISAGWGHLQCSGVGSSPPATKGEINLNLADGIDYYDVSLVDGFNLPMQIEPTDYNTDYSNPNDPNGTFTCKAAGCLNTSTVTKCPTNLTYKPNGNVVACQDDCNVATALHVSNPAMYSTAVVNAYCCPDSEYCSPINPCREGSTCKAWLTAPGTCKNCSAYTGLYPNGYPTFTDLPNSAIFFHASCPNAYSFTYDDAAASYVCNSTPATGLRTKYTVTFCSPSFHLTPTPTPTSDSSDSGGDTGSAGPSGSTVASAPASNAAGTVSLLFNQQPTGNSPVGVSKVQISTGTRTESFAVTAQPVALGDAMQVKGHPAAGYLQISPVGVPDGTITSGTITFVVSGTWLTANNVAPANVELMRYNDKQWNALPTTFVSQSGDNYYFSAVTPGFSYFAITVKSQGSTAANVTIAETVARVTSLPLTTTTVGGVRSISTTIPVTGTPVVTQTTMPAPVSFFPDMTIGIAIAALVIIVIAAFLVRRWWIRRQNPALSRKLD
ncbi:thaumatin family protein [Methanoregula sp.]|uniref:thaumatin family protein n=1 Tax=Methanoregula sp. TaxID=2052170 RepID=UPI0035661CA8